MDAARPYAELTDEEQAEALRPAAMDAAAAFGLEVHRVELVSHAFNSTFSLEATDGQRLALRVNTNSTSSVAEVVTQQLWLKALAEETRVHVPRPVPTRRGEWCARVESAALGRPVYEPNDPFCRERVPDDRGASVDHFYTKLLKLAGTMQTAAGRREAERRTAFLRAFLAQLESEIGP